jgi:hypothetical protein
MKEGFEAEALRHHGQARRDAKGVGHVEHLGASATEGLAALPPDQQVADEGFPAGAIHVREAIHGPDFDAALPRTVPQIGCVPGADREVVLQHQHLPVELEAVVRIGAEVAQDRFHTFHQLQAKPLKGPIPGAVPVGVGDHMDGFLMLRE